MTRRWRGGEQERDKGKDGRVKRLTSWAASREAPRRAGGGLSLTKGFQPALGARREFPEERDVRHNWCSLNKRFQGV